MSHFPFAGFIGIVAISRIFFPSCHYLFFFVFGRDIKSNKCSEYSYIGLGDFLCGFFSGKSLKTCSRLVLIFSVDSFNRRQFFCKKLNMLYYST